MSDTCDGPHYYCGGSTNVNGGTIKDASFSQNIENEEVSFLLGNTKIIVSNRNRNFRIRTHYITTLSGATFAIPGAGEYPVVCGGETVTLNNNSLSEDYKYITTELCFLDTRYNHAAGTQLTQTINFSNNKNEMCTFRQSTGEVPYAKFNMDDVVINSTTEYFIVINGVKKVLDTVVTSYNLYTPDNPLIIVVPNPPTEATPLHNCADIIQYGFYDYHAVGEGEGQAKILRDGGDDYYFTDWMRTIGILNRTFDQSLATERYYAYYLREGGPETQDIIKPTVFVDPVPRGSITTDREGNVFYSLFFNGKYFNDINNGDINKILNSSILPSGNNLRFYPIGLV